ncbi:MAG: hypothetical protein ACFFD4_30935 [Candidatus Odinarchaeota archaeon]
MSSELKEKINEYFTRQDQPFFVIFDRSASFKHFFEKLNLTGVNILIIDSSKSPGELLYREKIVNDFNLESGWYSTKWIIYICGEFTDLVQQSNLFLYYSRLGASFNFQSFWDVLLDSNLGMAQQKSWHYDFESDEEIISYLSPLFSSVPLSCFIDKQKSIPVSSFWMGFLRAYEEQIDCTDLSPVFLTKKNTGETFDVDSLILELIYFYDPSSFEVIRQEPFNHVEEIFSVINDSFSRRFPFTTDFDRNMSILVNLLFLNANPEKAKPKKKKGGLISYFPEGSEFTPSLKSKVKKIIEFWVNRNDNTLKNRHVTWSEIIRANMNLEISDEPLFVELQDSFAYTADVDLKLMNYLLSSLERNISYERWQSMLDDLITRRKSLWEQHASLWWEKERLFSKYSSGITLQQLWHLVYSIGIILLGKQHLTRDWARDQELAWSVEKAQNYLISTIEAEFFDKLPSLKFIKPFITNALDSYQSVQAMINESFAGYYSSNYQSGKLTLARDQAFTAFKNASSAVEQDMKVALVFIDALRADLSAELGKSLASEWVNHKSIIRDFKVASEDSYTLLPSITGVGWPAVLLFDGTLAFTVQNGQLVTKIIEDSEEIILRNPDDRNKRILRFFKSSHPDVELFQLEQKNIPSSVSELKKSLLNSSNVLIPVLWYRKFDDHEKSRKEFFSTVSKDLELLRDLIFQLHFLGFSRVHVFTDHGFYFAKNSDVAKDIPNQELNPRYCVSTTAIDNYDQSKYPDWHFWIPGNKELGMTSERDLTVILPRGSLIFKKLGQDERLVHGGLSFQECNIKFLTSTCQLAPKVQISSIELVEHEIEKSTTGEDIVALKEGIEGHKLLEIKLAGSKPTTKDEKLKHLKVKVDVDFSESQVKPSGIKTLKSGSSITYKIYLKNLQQEQELTLTFTDENNETIRIQKFLVKSPLYEIF